MTTVFLGGTCNGSTWRDELIPLLTIDYYNPVVPNWKPEHLQEELRQRAVCEYVLYVITADMTGVYSIAEAVDDSNKRPDRTLFMFDRTGFDRHQLKALEATAEMISKNRGKVFESLESIAEYLNQINM